MTTWADNGDGNWVFEVMGAWEGAGAGWVAAGFSRDAFMGDDTVLMVNGALGEINLYWNIDAGTNEMNETVKYSAPVGNDEGLVETLVDAAGDVVYGRVVRQVRLEFQTPTIPPAEEVNDLAPESFFLLCTSGNVDEDSLPTKHIAGSKSGDAIDFTDVPAL